MVGGGGDEGQGAHSPRCCPCCVRTPRAHLDSPTLVRTPPRSFVLSRACSYSPALICTLLPSFVLPRARSYSPALVCTLLRSFVLPCARLYPPALLRTPPHTLCTCLRSFVAAAAIGVGAPVPALTLFVLVHAIRSRSFGLYLHLFVLIRTPLGSFICIKCKVSIHHN